jgi:hypothetical protein
MTRTDMNTVCSKGCWRAKGIVPVVPLYVPAETMHVPRSSKLDPDLDSRACCIRRVPAVVPTVGTDSRPCPHTVASLDCATVAAKTYKPRARRYDRCGSRLACETRRARTDLMSTRQRRLAAAATIPWAPVFKHVSTHP